MSVLPMQRKRDLDGYFRDLDRTPLLDRTAEGELARRARTGDEEARAALVRANLRFVVRIAKEYQNLGLPLADLIAEGNVGLLEASTRYDERRGVKFISYAVWWVRQAIRRALSEAGRTIRLGPHITQRLAAVDDTLDRLEQEVSGPVGVDDATLAAGFCVATVREWRAAAAPVLDLDAPVFAGVPGDDDTYASCLPDLNATDPGDDMDGKRAVAQLRSLVARLPHRERAAVTLYFGLEGGEPRNLEQAGAVMDLTRERVRQLRDRALLRLRCWAEEDGLVLREQDA